jgi:hypothetical protein
LKWNRGRNCIIKDGGSFSRDLEHSERGDQETKAVGGEKVIETNEGAGEGVKIYSWLNP